VTIAVSHPWLDNSSLRRLANGGCETTPILRHRSAPGCRTFQRQFAARAWKLDHDDLPASERSAAAIAATLVVERMPEMEFIEITQGIEFIFRVELERGKSAHASYPHNVANGLQSVSKLLPA
jgi:hypothetical protein